MVTSFFFNSEVNLLAKGSTNLNKHDSLWCKKAVDLAVWSIAHAQIIITDYKICVSKNYSIAFNFIHDACVRNLAVSEMYENVNLCDWKIPGIWYTWMYGWMDEYVYMDMYGRMDGYVL